MKQVIFAVPLGILAFWCAVILIEGFFGSGHFSFVVGCAAAYAVYAYYRKIDRKEIEELSRGKSMTLASSFPEVWGGIKDVLARHRFALPGSGLVGWHVAREDSNEGLIIATISVVERVNNNTVISTDVTVTFRIAVPGESESSVSWSYQTITPMGHHRAASMIRQLDAELQRVLQVQALARPVGL